MVQLKCLKRLSVSIRTFRNVKPRRAVVTQFCQCSVPTSSGQSIHKVHKVHKEYTFFFTRSTSQSTADCQALTENIYSSGLAYETLLM